MSNFASDRHALYAGWIVGLGMRHGVLLVPVRDATGNATDRLELRLPGTEHDGSVTLTLVVPEPPPGWLFTVPERENKES